jgi:hypothetical protein
MNQKLLALYGLKWNPFTPEVPTEALYVPPKVENFCWRIEQAHLREGGFALIHGYEKGPVMGRMQRMRLIRLTNVPRVLLIITQGFHIESSQVSSSGSRFQRGGLPGLRPTSTFSSAFRLVSRLARA